MNAAKFSNPPKTLYFQCILNKEKNKITGCEYVSPEKIISFDCSCCECKKDKDCYFKKYQEKNTLSEIVSWRVRIGRIFNYSKFKPKP